ncbi:MAG TPA: hypothetical protein VLJ39_17900 [Tepidisphaeraceae bacterium]|nr:hypothetical protein [Tepidisphaeraceae bacterium]
MSRPHALESGTPHEGFGHDVMGPILAGMLWRLQEFLSSPQSGSKSTAFFCARGGLVLRRGLELLAAKVGLEARIEHVDFMVSRIAAARVAIQRDPHAVGPLIERELEGRSCAQAANAFAGCDMGADEPWDAPFTMRRFTELMETTDLGRRVRAENDRQAELLRTHINALRASHPDVILCDTGVFGSIGRYLRVGVPEVNWTSALLFRANYKRMPTPHFGHTVGMVSQSDRYVPWQPATALLLYWPLMESMLEPDVPSVTCYHEDPSLGVVSNLQLPGWQDRLIPVPGSVLAGAFHYLAGLSPRSIATLAHNGQVAWKRLRRMIVFPSVADVPLLAVGRRGLDFGADEFACFDGQLDTGPDSLRNRFLKARSSMWPEGELRKQFPRMATPLQAASELGRLARAVYRAARTSR